MITENVSLKPYCSYQTGGSARYFARPKNIEELQAAIKWAKDKDTPFEILGGGANVLISDSGYKGLIISTLDFDKSMKHSGNIVTVGASTPLIALVNYTLLHSLAGLEKLAGVPGTVGGAIKMNAGAYDSEIKDILESVTVIDDDNSIKQLTNADCKFGYRRADGLEGYIITSATFALSAGDKQTLDQIKLSVLRRRAEKQPLNKPSCGSVFKRPEGNYAGTLIEEAGLKGASVGGAMVSEKHANFIVNTGGATSDNIYKLIEKVKQRVFETSGVTLECEVRFIGF